MDLIKMLAAEQMKNKYEDFRPGDTVKVELSPYDLTKGRIVYRER